MLPMEYFRHTDPYWRSTYYGLRFSQTKSCTQTTNITLMTKVALRNWVDTGTITTADVFTVDVGSQLTSISVSRFSYLAALEVNGQFVYFGTQTLTFADNTDLEYFQAGDVIQEGGLYSEGFTGEFQYPNTNLPPNEWLFAATQDGNTTAAYSKWMGRLTWTAPSNLANASSLRLVYRSTGG